MTAAKKLIGDKGIIFDNMVRTVYFMLNLLVIICFLLLSLLPLRCVVLVDQPFLPAITTTTTELSTTLFLATAAVQHGKTLLRRNHLQLI
jgi:hypothetical protein